MKIRAFITHKLAEHFSDCQDRFSISNDTKSVALADGMSQSYQQKVWADLLVKSFVKKQDFVPNIESIKELSVLWRNSVVDLIEQMKSSNAHEYLIIMNENALATHKSAGATFLGIRFNGNKWEGDVLGDSCLIVLQDNRIKDILTSQDGDEFDNHPDYFDSDSSKTGKGTPKQINGIVDANTSIMLVSDPFSDFLNEKRKEGKDEEYVKELLQVTNHDEFEELVGKWCKEFGMHNDDSTLIIIEDDGTDEFNCTNIDDIQSLIVNEQHEQKENANPTKVIPKESVLTSFARKEEYVEQTAEKNDDPIRPISEKDFIKLFNSKYKEFEKSRSVYGKKIKKFIDAQEKAIKYALEKMYESIFK